MVRSTSKHPLAQYVVPHFVCIEYINRPIGGSVSCEHHIIILAYSVQRRGALVRCFELTIQPFSDTCQLTSIRPTKLTVNICGLLYAKQLCIRDT